jgi:hypothetical protein
VASTPSPYQIESLGRRLSNLLQRTEALCAQQQARTYEELELQRVRVTVSIATMLETVQEVLPEELQPIVGRMLALYEEVWKRRIEPGGGERDAQ